VSREDVRALLACVVVAVWIDGSDHVRAQAITGARRVGQPVRIDFVGPSLDESAPSPNNPFLDYRGALSLTGPSGTVGVPLFFAADGNAANTQSTTGSIWRGYYVPSVPGVYTLTASFRTGPNVAIDPSASAGSSAGWFDGAVAQVEVGPRDPYAPGNYARGMLRYVARHHLQFDNGEWFLKGGPNSPENLLAYADFDGTFDFGGVPTPSLVGGLHRYGPHAAHFGMHPFDGSSLWDNGTKGHNLIGALNYLGSVGMDSVYFLTYSTNGGDGRDVWPWIVPEADKLHYDVSKLEQWERVFRHMDLLGIQLHLVTQEKENDKIMGTTLTTERRLYYRELVARFAHHNALQWNLGEESTHLPADLEVFATYVRGLDPYDHPIAFHTMFGAAGQQYPPFYGDSAFESSSIQGNASQYHEWAITVRAGSAAGGRPWSVHGDEQSPWVDSPVGDGTIGNLALLRRTALWANLMGGGAGVEWNFGYQSTFGDLESENWSLAEALWDDTRHALDFFRRYLPFEQMSPDDARTSASDDFCLARSGDTYAVYLPAGGTTSLSVAAGSYRVHWFDPRSGGALETGSVSGPATFALGNPPRDPSSDWAVLVWPCGAPTGAPALRVERLAGAEARLAWLPVFGALAFDAVRGDLATLRSSGGDFGLATDDCLVAADPTTVLDDPETPPPGGGFWYLVRPRSCSAGTYDSGYPGQVETRDPEIEGSSQSCP
jgi:Putative collagen-binding domain of a collagenase